MEATELDKWPALAGLTLDELHARKKFNSLLMNGAKHTPERVKEFAYINDILLLEINRRLDSLGPSNVQNVRSDDGALQPT